MKDSLESRIGARISEDSPIVPWLVMHAAQTINRYHVNDDGCTNYYRWKGKPFKREVAEFAESIMYLKPGTRGTHKFDPRWECGCWLGVKSETGEIIVGTSEGVVKARDFKRRGSPAERWTRTQFCLFAAHRGSPFLAEVTTRSRHVSICQRRGVSSVSPWPARQKTSSADVPA